jgi:hypothetical protein
MSADVNVESPTPQSAEIAQFSVKVVKFCRTSRKKSAMRNWSRNQANPDCGLRIPGYFERCVFVMGLIDSNVGLRPGLSRSRATARSFITTT